MDFSIISELVQGVGFPIAVCIALFYQNENNNKNYRELLSKMDNTIDNNTLALKELSVKLDIIKGENNNG